MVTWAQVQARVGRRACPACGLPLGSEVASAQWLYQWDFHPACLAAAGLAWAGLVAQIRAHPAGPCLPAFDDVPGWAAAPQRPRGPQVVPLAKVVGTSNLLNAHYWADWWPVPAEADARYARVLRPALFLAGLAGGGGPALAADFLDSLGYKHAFYFPRYDAYYVCMDGNRRTSAARVLGVAAQTYDVDDVLL